MPTTPKIKSESKGVELTKIADYAWLGETQRSWRLWVGNPLCVCQYTIPKKMKSKDDLTLEVRARQKKEQKRFAKMFPDTKWDSFDLTSAIKKRLTSET